MNLRQREFLDFRGFLRKHAFPRNLLTRIQLRGCGLRTSESFRWNSLFLSLSLSFLSIIFNRPFPRFRREEKLLGETKNEGTVREEEGAREREREREVGK